MVIRGRAASALSYFFMILWCFSEFCGILYKLKYVCLTKKSLNGGRDGRFEW